MPEVIQSYKFRVMPRAPVRKPPPARPRRDPVRAPRLRTASADNRARLLRVGRSLVARHGLRGLTVRALAQKAGVNLGSFVYHFGTREAFIAELIEDWYAPFYGALQVTEQADAPPLQRLRALLVQLLEFVVANRGFVLHVIADAATGEPAARRFMQSLASRHPAMLLRVLAEAQEAGDIVRALPLQQMVFVLASSAVPVVVFTGLQQARALPRELAPALDALADDLGAALQRLDWALAGLRAGALDGERP